MGLIELDGYINLAKRFLIKLKRTRCSSGDDDYDRLKL